MELWDEIIAKRPPDASIAAPRMCTLNTSPVFEADESFSSFEAKRERERQSRGVLTPAKATRLDEAFAGLESPEVGCGVDIGTMSWCVFAVLPAAPAQLLCSDHAVVTALSTR